MVPGSFDLHHRSALWTDEEARVSYRTVLPLVEVLIAGEDEAALPLVETHGVVGAARALADLGPGEAVLALGASGPLVVGDTGPDRAPGAPVTVGPGDAFVAGYLHEWVSGAAVDRRLALSVATGAFACQVSGDWEGFPRPVDLHLLDTCDPVQR